MKYRFWEKTFLSKSSYFCPRRGIAFLKAAVYNGCNFVPHKRKARQLSKEPVL